MVVPVDDFVSCGDDPLLSDAVRVGGCESGVGNNLVCGAGVAWSDRGDTEVVVEPRVVQPGWVDGVICSNGFLRPDPPPMHSMCLHRMLLTAACCCSSTVSDDDQTYSMMMMMSCLVDPVGAEVSNQSNSDLHHSSTLGAWVCRAG